MYRFFMIAFFAILYSCNFSPTHHVIQFDQLEDYKIQRWEHDSSVLVMSGNGTVTTMPMKLPKAKYTLSFFAAGTPAQNTLPRLNVFIGDYFVKDLRIKEGRNKYTLKLELPKNEDTVLSLTFDNDYSDAKEDRNIYIYFPIEINSF